MREQNRRRYRAQTGKLSSERARRARAQYKRIADNQSANSNEAKMTYDDYLAQIKDAEKIIEIDDDTRWIRFKDFLREYTNWLDEKKDKYAPIVAEKVKNTAQKQITDDGVPKKAINYAQRRLKPLYQRFGVKNVHYAGLTGIVVLVLLGGFFLTRGGGEQGVAGVTDDISVTDTGLNQNTEPTFTVAEPEEETGIESEIFFDPELGVASYRSRIRGNEVTVSQQPLTEAQKGDKEGQLEEIAVQLLAERSFESKFGTVYIADTAPDGTNSQVAVFMTEELLIFIRTGGAKIAIEGWAEYIQTIKN